MQRFYVLKSAYQKTFRGDTEFSREASWNPGEAFVCAACGRYTSELPWRPPYRAELECWGTEFGDCVFDGEGFLVSGRFRMLFDQTNLTGLQGFYPVEIVRVKRHRRFEGDPPCYSYVEVARSQTAIDEVKSEFEGYDDSSEIPLSVCLTCRRSSIVYPKRWKRLVMQEGTWSGEDIFIPRGIADFITTKRFKAFCELNRITNATFVPADEYWKDFYPHENLEKARELISREAGKDLLEKITSEGDVARYEPSTNYMVVASTNRTIRYICRPFGGIQEWLDL